LTTTVLREFNLADHGEVIALWQACGLHPSRSDRLDAIARKLERDPDLFLVIAEDGRVIASALGSYDGRRGWINRLAVAPAARGRALGQRLVHEFEARLAAKGCEKVNLLIERDNEGVAAFYAQLGYAVDDLVFMEKWITPQR
jgi:ribosomal protein S18 acetylase RimI-like enzyme